MPRPKRAKVATTIRRIAKPAPAPERTRVPTEELEDEQIEVPDSQVSAAPNEKPAKRATRGNAGTTKVAPSPETRGRGRIMDSVEAESSAPMPDVTTASKTTGRAFKRRARQGSILGPRRAMDRSVSVESELAQSQNITNMGRDISGMEVPMSAFKPRRRQGSILGDAGWGRDRDSSAEPERDVPSRPGSAMGGGGLFKRRVRQGSILGTPGFGGRRETGGEAGLTDDESALAGFDDFMPEDESTPLNHPQRILPSTELASAFKSVVSSSPNPRKRKVSPNEPQPEPQPSSPNLPQLSRSTSRRKSPSKSASASDSLSPPPAHITSPIQRTPDPPSATYAPPHSSSSLNLTPSPIRAAPRRPAVRTPKPKPKSTGTRRQPARGAAVNDDDDLPSSPPSLTHSPDNAYTAKGAVVAKRKGKPVPAMMATAELQALLPRRRVRRQVQSNRDVFEINSEDEDGSADELSILPPIHRYGRGSAAPAPVTNKRVTKLKPTAKSKRRVSDPDADADKENEESEVDPDDSLAPLKDTVESEDDENEDEGGKGRKGGKKLDEKAKKEIEKAKKKFAQVDEWEMEFESVTAEASSQVDAR